MSKVISVGYGDVEPVEIGGSNELVYLGGPCAIENRDHTFFMAEKIKAICEEVGIKLIFKSCYDKDCRSSPAGRYGSSPRFPDRWCNPLQSVSARRSYKTFERNSECR